MVHKRIDTSDSSFPPFSWEGDVGSAAAEVYSMMSANDESANTADDIDVFDRIRSLFGEAICQAMQSK